MVVYVSFVCVRARRSSALHILPQLSARGGIRAAERSRLMTRRSTSHKHTYLASCHHVGEFGMLVDCQAQNVVAVFCIETLAGCKETHPHTGWNTATVWLISRINHEKNNDQSCSRCRILDSSVKKCKKKKKFYTRLIMAYRWSG